jgi:hypothetical protein
MRHLATAAALLLVAAPAFAQGDGLKTGLTIRDSAGKRLGTIDRVLPDGSVRLILGGRFVRIPADKVSVAEGKVTTSLTKREASRLN